MSTETPTTARPRPSILIIALNYLSYLFLFAVCATLLFLAGPLVIERLRGTAAVSPAQPTPAPTLAPATPAPPPAIVPPAPIVVQSVPQGAAPQPISIPQPAPIVVPAAPQATPQEAAPAPIVIVLHENDYGHPIVTGSGACKVAAKGARRCGQ